MSALVEYAESELRRAGLFDADSDYGGALGHAVMDLVRAHSGKGHSGMSHGMAMELFRRVANFKPLTPLTSDPAEWMEVDTGKMWQSRRQPSCFSKDGGKTWYDIDAPDERRAKTRTVCLEVEEERERQHQKWGEQNHPDGTGIGHLAALAHDGTTADDAKRNCQMSFGGGHGTYLDILWEEFAETAEEADPEKLRAELIQVAAVAVAWVEAIDRRRRDAP